MDAQESILEKAFEQVIKAMDLSKNWCYQVGRTKDSASGIESLFISRDRFKFLGIKLVPQKGEGFYFSPEKAVEALLKIWRETGQKMLIILFSQHNTDGWTPSLEPEGIVEGNLLHWSEGEKICFREEFFRVFCKVHQEEVERLFHSIVEVNTTTVFKF